MMAKTREEIERLEQEWKFDPCWDLEKTHGFEEHADELRAFREAQEWAWKQRDEDFKSNVADSLNLHDNSSLVAYLIALENRVTRLEEKLKEQTDV